MQEKIFHVFRRLGMGPHPDLAATVADPEEAIARALDPSGPAPTPPTMDAPLERDDAQDPAQIADVLRWWLSQMVTTSRPLEERLIWFWHDHFATALRKVRVPYLMWRQHLTIRRLATGSFRDLLHATATDGAMLLYLDGIHNAGDAPNENYAREVMELHTMGPGTYTQTDVTEAARAFTGWVVHIPYIRRIRRVAGDTPPWASFFVPQRHDAGTKTLLGRSGPFDLPEALDVILEQPATATFVARKLFVELVGLEPDPPTLTALAARFRDEYSVTALAEEIVSTPAFLSDEAVRAKIRTPVERLVGLLQGFAPGGDVAAEAVLVLHRLAYLPFNPPNPAGFPRGRSLLGPYQLTHLFDLLRAIPTPPELSTAAVLARLGLAEVSSPTRTVLDRAPDGPTRVALAFNSPEYALT